MRYFLFGFVLAFLYACNDGSPAAQPKVEDSQHSESKPNVSQKEMELELESKKLENKELQSTKSFLETQKKMAEELTEKFKAEASGLQQKLQAQLKRIQEFQADKEKQSQLLAEAQQKAAELEDKIKNMVDATALSKELREKNELLKSLIEELTHNLKDETKAIQKKLQDQLEQFKSSNEASVLKIELEEKNATIRRLTEENEKLKVEVKKTQASTETPNTPEQPQ